MGTTYDQAYVHVTIVTFMFRELSYMAGRVGLAGLSLFAAIVEHTIEAYSVQLFPRVV